ncbi:MAG: metalloendopeptidase [Anaerolineae bacterium]|nr:MAG: metalloendopeptidase [Anaerolineae bacterium]
MDSSLINPLFGFASLLSTTSDSSKDSGKQEPSIDKADFRQLLTLILLSNMMSQGTSNGDSDTFGMGNLMAPLMLGLFEKLLADQVETVELPKAPKTTSESVNSPRGLPVKGRLTQGSHAGHVALDFGVPVGTPVKATLDGKVVYAGWNDQGYGNLVIIENGPYRVYFAHLSKIPVKLGEKVTAGTIIGYSGNTGNSTGPHLHYEVRKNGQAIDPTSFTMI